MKPIYRKLMLFVSAFTVIACSLINQGSSIDNPPTSQSESIETAPEENIAATQSVIQSPDDGSRFPVQIGDLYGYINRYGDIVIEPQFQYAARFHENLALVQAENSLYGYIDRSGVFAIEPQYDIATSFSERLAGASLPNTNNPNNAEQQLHGFINHEGKFVIEEKYIWLSSENGEPAWLEDGYFHEGFAKVFVPDPIVSSGNPGALFVDKQGNETPLKPAYYPTLSGFSEGFAVIAPYKPFTFYPGLIDTQGNLVFKGDGFGFLYPFSEGLAAFQHENHTTGFIDKNFDIVISGDFVEVKSFSNGLAAVRSSGGDLLSLNDLWGFIDTFGNLIIDYKYSCVRSSFMEGWAAVCDPSMPEGGFYLDFIDKTGNEMNIPIGAVSTEGFIDGLAFVTFNTQLKYAYIDINGNIVFSR